MYFSFLLHYLFIFIKVYFFAKKMVEKIEWENFKNEREKLIRTSKIHPSTFMDFGTQNISRNEYEEHSINRPEDGFVYPDDIVKNAEKTKSGFPKILWRTYKDTNIPKRWIEGFESGALLKGWILVFMTDEDNLDFVKRHYPSLLTLYQNFEYPIERVDLVRILYLHRFGGLYSDLDKVFLTDFTHIFEEYNAEVYLVRSPNMPSTYTNSFMASKPNARFWVELIESIAEQNLPFYAWGRHLKVMNTAGPMILTRVARNTDSVISNLPGKFFESCSVCHYPCKASIETGQYVKQIEGSSWISVDTKVYLCFLCSWPQIIFVLVVLISFILIHFLI